LSQTVACRAGWVGIKEGAPLFLLIEALSRFDSIF
jgi:hypothetical protein